MRFEIRSGGIIAIVVGVALLSGAVFVLGILAGYDVGRESQTAAAQVATAYPLQAPPVTAQNGAIAVPVTAPAAVQVSAGLPSPSEAMKPDPSGSGMADKDAGSGASSEPDAIAQGPSSTPTPSPSASEDSSGTSADDNTAAAEHPAEVPGSRRHKPYNIQIRAAMDLNGGNAMTKRLAELGYQAHLRPTQIAGQTWYRVEIGPYDSQHDAAAAEAELRQKYNTAYGSGRPTQAQAAAANPAEPPAQSPGSAQSSPPTAN